jgi:hypothetical protein
LPHSFSLEETQYSKKPCLTEWDSNLLLIHSLIAEEFRIQLTSLSSNLNSLKENYDTLNIYEMKSILDSIILINKAFTISRDNITAYLKSSNMVIQKYKHSEIRKKIFINMMILKDNIDDSGLIELLEQAVEDLSQGRKVHDISDLNIDAHLKKINLNLDGTLENLNDFLMKGNGYFSKLKNFFWNDSFGDLLQAKCDLKIKYLCEDITLKTEDNNSLDAYS